MLVISLDEYGKFEGSNRRRSLVAGTVYSCACPDDMFAERRRIVAYLKQVCRESDAEFPTDLHPLRESGGPEILNLPQLQRVQDTLRRTLPAFFAGAEPRSRYCLYAVVAEEDGVSAFEREGLGNLLSDSYAGNRYLHISQMALRNLIINNPVLRSGQYHLDLATRIIGLNSLKLHQQEKMIGEAKELGMQQVRWSDGTLSEDYQLTDINSYLAMLSATIGEDVRKDIRFNLNVQSIKYVANENTNEQQAFLLLADMVCSLFQPALVGGTHTARRLLELANSITTHSDNLIWCYHDVDFAFRKARNQQLAGQWFDCLLTLHEICGVDSEQAQFYREEWVPVLLEKMRQQLQPQLVADAARHLARYLQQPNCSVGAGRYVADRICEFMTQVQGEQYNQCRYLLHSCLMELCNHEGDHAQACHHYQCCEVYALSAPLDEYLELRNRYSVTLLDRLEYEAALENTEKTLQLCRTADDLRAQASGQPGGISIVHGRTLSQLGQCLAFLGQYPQAQEAFMQALEVFRCSPVDLQITRSYLLHCYIEAGDRKGYEALAKDYFGTADWHEQLHRLNDMEDTTVTYALLLWLKSLYRFAPLNLYPRQAEAILSPILDLGIQQAEHPWELIWKYVALLAVKYKLKKHHTVETVRLRLQAMRDNSQGLLRQICEESLQSCDAGRETSSLTYMHR